MAANEEGEEARAHGNEWEMVSLTDSAYAAAPGPKKVELKNDDGKSICIDDAGETSDLVLSRHFVYPPSQHEKLLKEPASDYSEKDRGQENLAEVHAEGDRSKGKDEIDSILMGSIEDPVNINGKGLKGLEIVAKGDISKSKDEIDTVFKDLNKAAEFPGINFADSRDDPLSSHGEFCDGKTLEDLNLDDKEKSIYDAATKAALEIPSAYVENLVASEVAAVSGISEDIQDLTPAGTHSSKPAEDDNLCGSDLPCAAWWKRRAASFYAHAKEANSFWSVFVAAAVLGLVILGHRWQQERWQVLQLRWHVSINEKTGRMLGPLSRLKESIVGGHRRDAFIGATAREN